MLDARLAMRRRNDAPRRACRPKPEAMSLRVECTETTACIAESVLTKDAVPVNVDEIIF